MGIIDKKGIDSIKNSNKTNFLKSKIAQTQRQIFETLRNFGFLNIPNKPTGTQEQISIQKGSNDYKVKTPLILEGKGKKHNSINNKLRKNKSNNTNNTYSSILNERILKEKSILKKLEGENTISLKKLHDQRKQKQISTDEFSKLSEIEGNKVLEQVDKINKLESEKRIEEIKELEMQMYKDYKVQFIQDLGVKDNVESFLKGKNIQNGGSNCFGVYEIFGTDYIILKRSEGSYEWMGDLPYYTSLLDNNPNIPRTLQVFVKNGYTYQIMEKAKGKSLTEISKEEFYDIYQEEYDKLVENILLLKSKGLVIDPSKASNFFYDSQIGFSIIDLSSGNMSLEHLEKNLMAIFSPGNDDIIIKGKIKKALKNNGL